uniref:Putative secreted protein n=1 Tax=Panstrongylus lignarius TaxID=156445 RepID=A0A224XU04_9HEMI
MHSFLFNTFLRGGISSSSFSFSLIFLIFFNACIANMVIHKVFFVGLLTDFNNCLAVSRSFKAVLQILLISSF